VVEGDHAVCHILLEAIFGDGAIATFSGNDGGDAPILQPEKEPAEL